jgi:hypothetical protein
MNSKEKNDTKNQKSILSFFSSSTKNNSNKRTHEEMLRGELNNTEIITKKLKLNSNEEKKQEVKIKFN